MKKTIVQLTGIFAAFLLILCAMPLAGFAEGNESEEQTHYLAFASDYHSTEGSIENAMIGMPGGVGYVSLIGDMVGEKGGDHPVYQSAEILSHVKNVFPDLNNENVSIIWADHDVSVDDEGTDITKGIGGYGSCEIYEALNEDKTPAYYVYMIAFYEMLDGGSVSADAAAKFKTWVDGIDHTVPIIVLCHAPIQGLRGDNNGAAYWNEALNYAATGVEGIVSTEETGEVIRDVLFFHGHNHTNDKTEYYFAPGGTMDVQIDTNGNGPLSASAYDDSEIEETEVDDQEYEQLEISAKAKTVKSNIYYTSLTAGYLKTSGNGTLATITDGEIKLTKYNGTETVSLGTNGTTGEIMDSEVVIPRQQHIAAETVEENELAPTCEEEGAYDEVTYCSICGLELSRETVTVPPTGHDWGDWVIIKEATSEEPGLRQRVCNTDPSHVEAATIDGDKEDVSDDEVPDVIIPDDEVPAAGGETVKTGDTTDLWAWMLVMAVSAVGLGTIFVVLKLRNRNENGK